MVRSEDDPPRDKRALGLSILVHLLAAPLFVAILAGSVISLPETITVTSGSFRTTLEHRTPKHATARAVAHEAAPARAPAQPHTSTKAVRQIVATSAHRPIGSPTHTPPRIAIAIPTVAPTPGPTASGALHPKDPAAAADAAASHATAQPTADANPDPAPSSVALAQSGGPVPAGGWGQNFRDPTVLDDSAVTALHARYHGEVVVRVDVDEDGHATRVTIAGANLDADDRAEIEKKLAALRYIPAECNGLRCAASLQIRV